ncbi:ABC transporter ATP-binding protein [Methylobacterium indicum]|uniref:sugar ABC transporter ATP-binding protein n=1 Tax=Methylobacterium indicum TaxID=1775910 RepID=UPI000733D8A6|nr:sugar ABC transporter ATP-binding protein [Methylobacterium indicum]KTS37225.1 ABC transporter ATP-binding protein [Methylobacterium indicum]KTS37542.1 ABC transporter ATP-binding protein [Methylobacterium indicum]KTS54476.1 ABC transporter ATP-binding protein [Methylobacterium indicum]
MTPHDLLVEATGIRKSFGATSVLRGVDLRIAPGEIHALLGGNGAGKSTLIRIVSGSLRRDAGDLTIRGDGPNPIAVVFQELALLPHLSVAENIYLPHLRRGIAPVRAARRRDEARAALAQIDERLAREALDRPVAEIDLHERQLIEIARALGSGARLLLLDEPTANLTFAESERLFALLRRLAGQGISTLLVSHRMKEIRAVAEVCTILRDGLTVVDRRPLADLDDAGIVEAMGQKAAVRGKPARATAIRPDGTTVAIAGPGLTVTLPPGTVLGLAGAPAGPGQLIDALVGAAPGSAWRISLDGAQADLRDPARAVRQGIGYVSGDRAEKGLLTTLPILDNVVAATRVAARRWLARRREADVAGDALARLSIKAGSVDDSPLTLSGGTQQKLLLARWLEHPPRMLVLEEPTRGVDIGTKREIYALIREMAARGTVVVWWSTEFPELIEICDRIVAFDLRGEVSGVIAGAAIDEVALAQATGMAA